MMSEWAECEDHETLAEALMEIVESEVEAIRTLDLGRYAELAQRRLAVSRHAVELAKEVPVSNEVRSAYRWVHQTSQENLEILQETQQMVRAIIQRLAKTPDATYSAPGRARSRGQGMMIWKG